MLKKYLNKDIVINLLKIILLSYSIFSTAYAFNFAVDKTRLNLSLSKPVDTLRLKNKSQTTEIRLQVQIFKWRQENGRDVYESTNDLIIAPVQITIPPGRSQMIRIGWRKPVPITKEIVYRLYVQEQTKTRLLTGSINTQPTLNLAIPVFIKSEKVTH